MNGAAITQPVPYQRAVILAVIAHAILLAAWWWAAIYADIDLPSVAGRVWLPFALAWIAWPIFAVAKYRRSPAVWVAVVVGAALIAPTVSTIYVFSVWSIFGFAP